jgi:hypothetical protein
MEEPSSESVAGSRTDASASSGSCDVEHRDAVQAELRAPPGTVISDADGRREEEDM